MVLSLDDELTACAWEKAYQVYSSHVTATGCTRTVTGQGKVELIVFFQDREPIGVEVCVDEVIR